MVLTSTKCSPASRGSSCDDGNENVTVNFKAFCTLTVSDEAATIWYGGTIKTEMFRFVLQQPWIDMISPKDLPSTLLLVCRDGLNIKHA